MCIDRNGHTCFQGVPNRPESMPNRTNTVQDSTYRWLQAALFFLALLVLLAGSAAAAPRIVQSVSVQSPPCDFPGQPIAPCGTGLNQLTINFAPTKPGNAIRLIYIGTFTSSNRVCTDNLGNAWDNNFGASDRGGVSVYGASPQSLARAGLTSITCVGGIISNQAGSGPFGIGGFSSLEFIEISGVPGGAFINPFDPGVNSSPVGCAPQTGFELMILAAQTDTVVQFTPQSALVQPLFVIPNANATIFFDPDGTDQLFDFSPSPVNGFQPVFCISLGFPFAEIVDPAPVLVRGSAVISVNDQIRQGPGVDSLATFGRPVQGVAADGVTQLLIRVAARNAGDQFIVRVLDDQGNTSTLPSQDGALGNPGDPSSSITTVTELTVTAVSSSTGAYAFAVYRAPLDFPASIDDNTASRKVTIQVVDPLRSALIANTPLTIVRPPVALIHGLWSSRDAWNGFLPLVTGPNGSDPRFFLIRPNYNNAVGRVTLTNPVYTAKDLEQLRTNSLGFAFNAPSVLSQVLAGIADFRRGNNPAHIAVAAAQFDVVAHSMGGDIIRTLPLQPGYQNLYNFNQGAIHKAITIATPHQGTPIAGLFLDPANQCTRDHLTGSGFALVSATISGRTELGAVGDLNPGSPAIQAIQGQLPQIIPLGTRPVPTALIAGVYTDWAALDKVSGASGLRFVCKTDPLPQSLTPLGWPRNFAPDGQEQRNDALVGILSALDGNANGTGFHEDGFVHSADLAGRRKLGFSFPSVLDANTAVSALVIQLLNTSVPNPLVFNSLGPSSQ